jgi:hypothetical protein
MKKFLFAIMVALLSACTPQTNSVDGSFEKPPELQDCKFYRMRSSSGDNLTVIRCPNSVVSTTSTGKNKKKTVTIDGTVFEQKE